MIFLLIALIALLYVECRVIEVYVNEHKKML